MQIITTKTSTNLKRLMDLYALHPTTNPSVFVEAAQRSLPEDQLPLPPFIAPRPLRRETYAFALVIPSSTGRLHMQFPHTNFNGKKPADFSGSIMLIETRRFAFSTDTFLGAFVRNLELFFRNNGTFPTAITGKHHFWNQ